MGLPRSKPTLAIDIIVVGLTASIVGTVGNWLVVGVAAGRITARNGAPAQPGETQFALEVGPELVQSALAASRLVGLVLLTVLWVLAVVRHGLTAADPSPAAHTSREHDASPAADTLLPTDDTGIPQSCRTPTHAAATPETQPKQTANPSGDP